MCMKISITRPLVYTDMSRKYSYAPCYNLAMWHFYGAELTIVYLCYYFHKKLISNSEEQERKVFIKLNVFPEAYSESIDVL